MNNIMFDVIYGLRKWRKNKLLFILSVVSLSFLILFLTISTSLVVKLSENQPTWVGKRGNFATVGRSSEDGQLMYTSLNNINEFSTLPGVKAATSLILETTKLEFDNHAFQLSDKNVQAAFIQDNFSDMLKFNSGTRFIDISEGLISYSFWIQLGKPRNLLGTVMYLTDKRVPVSIIGIASQKVDFVGLVQPDIWVRQELYKSTIEIDLSHMGLSKEQEAAFMDNVKNNLMFEVPIAYGILELNDDATANNLSNTYTNKFGLKAKKNKNVNSSGDGLFTIIVDGIDFNPSLTKSVNEQWVLYFLFVTIFALVCFINLFSHTFNQYIYRTNEWSIRRVVGANTKKILYQLIIESLPLIFSVTIMAFFMHFLFYNILVAEYWKDYLGKYSLSSDAWLLCTIYIIIISAIISCYFVPVLLLKNNITFTNIGSELGTKASKRVIKISCFAQLSVTLFFLASIMSTIQFIDNKVRSINIKQDLVEFHYETSNLINLSPSQMQSLTPLKNNDVAYSAYSLVAPNAIRWDVSARDGGSGVSQSMPLLPVSLNFFDSLNVELNQEYDLNENNIILNQSAAKLLFGQIDDALGNNVSIKNYEGEIFKVAAIVEDIPHYGVNDVTSPVVYSLLSRIKNKEIIYFFGHSSQIELIDQLAKDIIGYGKLIKNGSVAKNIIDLDIKMRTFYAVFMFFGCLIIVSIFVTFAYQFSNSLSNESKNIAIFKTLGITNSNIAGIYIKKNTLMVLLSIIMSLCLSILLNELTIEISRIEIYNLYIFSVATVLLFIITTAIAFPTLKQIVNTSVFKWLRM